jgi:hypothetical protein
MALHERRRRNETSRTLALAEGIRRDRAAKTRRSPPRLDIRVYMEVMLVLLFFLSENTNAAPRGVALVSQRSC